MKKTHLFISLTLLCLMSCTEKEIPMDSALQEVSVHHLFAEVPKTDNNSRVSVQETKSVFWSPGDNFIAFNGENQQARFTLEGTEYTAKGKFTSADNISGGFVCAGFPSSANPSFDGQNISFYLPGEYTTDSNSQNSAMWGEITNGNVTFQHLMSVLRIYVGNLDYSYNKIIVETDKVISGKFVQSRGNIVDGLMADASNTDAQNKTIVITRSMTHSDVYIPLPANTYSSIVVKAVKGAEASAEPYVLTNVTDKTLKCGYVYRVGRQGICKDVFAKLNLDYPGLEEVKRNYDNGNGDLNKAAAALLDYFRNRTNVVNPEIENLKENATNTNQANQALEYRFVVAKFVEDDRSTSDKADDVYYSFRNTDGSIKWGFKPNVAGVDREFLYQQHRHQWMEPQARAYAVSGNEEYVKSWMDVYASWMRQYPCPNKPFDDPTIKNLELGYEWKALQPAQRVAAQLNYIPLFIRSANFAPEFFTIVLNAFAETVEMIRMNYLNNGNIRLTQGESVAKAGLLMPEFKNSNDWIQDGLQKMNIDEQFLSDGVHYDLCFGYHMGALSSFVKMNALAQANNRHDVFSPEYITKLKNAVSFVEAMIYPDYTVDNFNDSHSSSYSKKTLQNRLKDYLVIFPDDEGLKWMAWEGKKGGIRPAWQNKAFDGSGYYMLRSKEWSKKSGLMVIHTNNYNPTRKWHCQPDNGTFSLWYNGTNFLPDAGYYTYNDPDPTRKKYRSYTMHNTLSCFGKDISEYRQNGKMLKQESAEDYELIVTENMPYKKGTKGNQGDIYHRRAIYMVDNKFIVLVDEGHSEEPNLNVKLNLNFHLYAEKGRKAEIVSQPSAENKCGLVKTNLSKNNILMKFFTDTKTCSKDFKIDTPSDIKVSNTPGKTIGETRDFIRVTERKNSSMSAARFITVIYPFAGPADASKLITARFTDNEAGKEGTFHADGAAVEVTLDGKTYKLAYVLK